VTTTQTPLAKTGCPRDDAGAERILDSHGLFNQIPMYRYQRTSNRKTIGQALDMVLQRGKSHD